MRVSQNKHFWCPVHKNIGTAIVHLEFYETVLNVKTGKQEKMITGEANYCLHCLNEFLAKNVSKAVPKLGIEN